MALSAILSDTLEFRSPTTTRVDRQLAEQLAQDLGVDIPSYAAEMFEAKSDVSHLSEAELLRLDSKEYSVDGTDLRISVLETVAPQAILRRKDALVAAMPQVAAEDGADQVLLFVVDILKEEATLLVPNELTRRIAEATFGVTVPGDAVVLPGSCPARSRSSPR
jgi:manganese-dependent inorganic pyrophosphatase